MIGWLTSKVGLWVIGGGVLLALLGGAYWKVTSYIAAHEELEAAYERQALQLDQAVEVNRHNEAEMVRIAAQHEATLAQLQGQLDSEATTMSDLEQQLARLRSMEPEVRYVTSQGETCPDPVDVVSNVLADPFGMPVEPSGGDGGDHEG